MGYDEDDGDDSDDECNDRDDDDDDDNNEECVTSCGGVCVCLIAAALSLSLHSTLLISLI